jgi:Holliday junction resolvase RusA-like endonuclease
MDPIAFSVYGTPQTAGSKKAFVVKSKNGGRPRAVVTDDNKRSKPWKDQVAQQAGLAMRRRELLRGPLEMRLVFHVRRPQGHFGRRGLLPSAAAYPITRPDLSKYTRAVEDALTGVVWHDDAQVVRQILEKHYGQPERVEICIRPLESQVSELPIAEQTSLLVESTPRGELRV